MKITVKTEQEKQDVIEASRMLHDTVFRADRGSDFSPHAGIVAMSHIEADDVFVEPAPSAPVEEDGEGAGLTSLDGVPGMGAPALASRGVVGSGDVGSGAPEKKKKTKLVRFSDFNSSEDEDRKGA